MMFNSLPVDITYVDEQDCVHIVNEVVDRLKSGEKDVENFWIQMGGKFILIQYFALRDNDGNYKGTIEVSQDVSDIKKLEGEKRLLDCDK